MTAAPKPILVSLNSAQREHAASMLDRFVDRSGGPDACWPWTGGSFNNGYGVFYTLGTSKTRRMIKAHRLAYELANDGESPPVVDHICHDNADCKDGMLCLHRRCCAPTHLFAETAKGNLSRAKAGIYQEWCSAGHRMSGENVYERPGGSRECRRCMTSRKRRQWTASPRRARTPRLSPRPVGVPAAELVAWALEGQDFTTCIPWPGSTPRRSGYSSVMVCGKTFLAHRLVYEVRNGPIPRGFVVDHACHDPRQCEGGDTCLHRGCVHPDHLRAIPGEINSSADRAVIRRNTDECSRGHELTDENLYITAKGARRCVACRNIHGRIAHKDAREKSNWEDKRFRRGNLCKKQRHDVTVTGVTPAGKCAECYREGQRARYWADKAAATA